MQLDRQLLFSIDVIAQEDNHRYLLCSFNWISACKFSLCIHFVTTWVSNSWYSIVYLVMRSIYDLTTVIDILLIELRWAVACSSSGLLSVVKLALVNLEFYRFFENPVILLWWRHQWLNNSSQVSYLWIDCSPYLMITVLVDLDLYVLLLFTLTFFRFLKGSWFLKGACRPTKKLLW